MSSNLSCAVRRSMLAAAITSLAALAPPAAAETVPIAMTGDPVTGSLSFRQDVFDIQAGDVMRFTNLNDIQTHEPLERNGLWSLSVAPRASVERMMEAGVHRIVCRLHPDFMTATIRVSPVTRVTRRILRKRDSRGRLRSRRIVRAASVRWAGQPPTAGQSFDVERRRQGQQWERWRSATTTLSGSFTFRAGDAWQVRARVRSGTVEGAWSPVVPVVS